MPKPAVQRIAALAAILLSLPGQLAEARKAPLATPYYDKLTEGAGPSTNDPQPSAVATIFGGSKNMVTTIAPISLDGPTNSTGAAASETTTATAPAGNTADGTGNGTAPDTNAPVLKSTISTTDYIPKGPFDPGSSEVLIPSKSVVGVSGKKKKGEITIKQAAMVNVMPIALMQSDDETKEKVETILDAEKKQLADLWEATLTRSQDIQFVVQKLMPTSNAPHAATLLCRALSMCMFGGIGAMGALSPNMGTLYAGQMGASMIMSVLGQAEGKAQKKAKISESESVMLYNMVRSTADKMVENYRDYKKSLASVARANEDMVALHNMAGESGTAPEASRQLEMEYTLRKAQRDIEERVSDLRKYRQALQDLAGPDAVAKLDKQIADENTAVASQTQTSITADGQQPAPAEVKTEDVQTEDDAKASEGAGGRQTASTPGSQG